VPIEHWNARMVPVARALAEPESCPPGCEPYVSMVDEAGQLFRVVVAGPILDETRRVLAHWRGLQVEAAGVVVHEDALVGVAAASSGEVAASSGEAAPSASAWIDSARCSSCDECVRRNPRMFVYDADKRAVLGDVRAGSYRELVEAAEHCKMAVIHPGEPWDANEPELSDLRQRAAVFG
jgi:pyruvate-ferredoxin/flavodoxin oxidoreductase